MGLNLARCLSLSAEANPDKVAVILDAQRLTYGEILQLVNRVANVLQDKGVQRGDKVAMMIPNTPYFPIVYYAILSVGATVVPVNCQFKAHEIQYYLEDSDSKVFFAWREFYPEALSSFNETDTCHHLLLVHPPDDDEQSPVGELLTPLVLEASHEFDAVETMPDDTAVILYTAGTTGRPKGAELTHFNVYFNALCAKDRITNAGPDDIFLAVLPFYHSFGQTCIMNLSVMAGATMTLMPKFEVPRVMEVIQRDKVTFLAAVPSMYFYMLNVENPGAYDLSSIRMAVSGGAALPAEMQHRFEEIYGVRILEGYGLSETSPVATFNLIDGPTKAGSIGLPIWGCEARIMCEDGSFAQVGEVGEIVIRGHNVMKGYYKKPAATEEAIVDGWFHTGDMAKTDADGCIYIVGRKKDTIIRGGVNVFPHEIEEVLDAHPAVLEAAVIGVPDEALGEEVKAFVAVRPGAHVTVEKLKAYCMERLARFKVPRDIEVVPHLPKDPTGKILKRDLRDTYKPGA